MKISKFQFEDKSLEWRLEELSFNKVTLLVGASGVGKTQILKALMGLKEISEGESLNGIAWTIEFETLYKQKYIWQGEFESEDVSISLDNNSEDDKKNKSKIVFEKLFLDNKLIVDRTSDKILFNGQPTIKLSPQESVLSLLKEEELVKPAHESLKKLHFSNQLGFAENAGTDLSALNKHFLAQYNTLEKIQESTFKTSVKLFLITLLKKPSVFNLIKERFVSIFTTVEDIKVEMRNETFFATSKQNILDIKIKERGVNKWIELPRMSWGMVRTLKQLSELYLCAEGTVFLIDEFENSLGINCINEITNDILASRRQLQFVLTSHHPYIIDAISFNNWKLVTRNAGIIKTHNIDKFGIGKSKHSAFMQLLQLEEYQTGQEQL